MDHLADMMVRFRDTLDDTGRQRIEQALKGLRGVAGVDFPAYRPRLAFVLYDPGRVHPQHILDQVQKASKMCAELIGPALSGGRTN